ncbi:MAG: FMN-binding negative transcriptional regulator [Methylocella sp.]|jgi:transcriptional regulator
MYVPSSFQETGCQFLQDAIRQARLATLVTFGVDGLEASHVPVILDMGNESYGTIYGHLARENPQWRRVTAEVPALAIFQGPDAYITPSWYATTRQTGKVVPTWNYVAVHAYGTIDFFDDPERLLALVTDLTKLHESKRAEPWAVPDAPKEYTRSQLNGIVGFRLPIARLEGNWKLSQNRSADDRSGVIDGLKREGGQAETAIAHLMTKKL